MQMRIRVITQIVLLIILYIVTFRLLFNTFSDFGNQMSSGIEQTLEKLSETTKIEGYEIFR